MSLKNRFYFFISIHTPKEHFPIISQVSWIATGMASITEVPESKFSFAPKKIEHKFAFEANFPVLKLSGNSMDGQVMFSFDFVIDNI